jgi:hypothetical protein
MSDLMACLRSAGVERLQWKKIGRHNPRYPFAALVARSSAIFLPLFMGDLCHERSTNHVSKENVYA